MLVDWLIRRAQRTPYFHLDSYMNRWWLIPYSNPDCGIGCGPVPFRKRPIAWLLQRCGIAVRIHEILRSDDGRHAHDHPWSYLTVILRGRYCETRFDDKGFWKTVRIHGPGAVLWRPAGSWHRLDLVNSLRPVTTLFITGPYRHTWGFNVDGVKVPHREYLKERK